ncbi:MAG: succinate dehydrogenase iron-sulfur subunit [Betaproteobacteria bacterium]|nr:succinate dehydrogenase iron-sulfur subunit [Betaproteobacteria bacterium]
MTFIIRRFDPEVDAEPRWVDYDVELYSTDRVLDALHKIKWEVDGSLSFRRSCAHGICGSDAMRINGRNRLACKTLIKDLDISKPIYVEAIKGLPLEKDLIVDMEPFYRQYRSIKPWLINDEPEPEVERLQSPEDRALLDGAYECILCACCTTACPSFWWNPDKFVGPAGLLQAYRFIADSRDEATSARLDNVEDPYRLYRCHGIMNCVDACPKGLNPTEAIGRIKSLLVKRRV